MFNLALRIILHGAEDDTASNRCSEEACEWRPACRPTVKSGTAFTSLRSVKPYGGAGYGS